MSTPQITDVIAIKNGPDAGKVWDSAKYAYRNSGRLGGFPVDFRGMRTHGSLRTGINFRFQIIGVIHEDGSGHSFILKGYVLDNRDDPAFRDLKTFYYNARTREGHFELS